MTLLPTMFPRAWRLITPYLLFNCFTYLIGAILFGLHVSPCPVTTDTG